MSGVPSRREEGGTAGRYCRAKPPVKTVSLLDRNQPTAVDRAQVDDVVTLGFSGPRHVAGATRIIEKELENVAGGKIGEGDFAFGPIERAGHATEVEVAAGWHRFELAEPERIGEARGRPVAERVGLSPSQVRE
jgi:hypothetical protein